MVQKENGTSICFYARKLGWPIPLPAQRWLAQQEGNELTGSQKHAQGRGEELVGRAGCPHLPSYLSAPLVWRAVVGSLLSVAPFLLSLQMLKTTWKCGNNEVLRTDGIS